MTGEASAVQRGGRRRAALLALAAYVTLAVAYFARAWFSNPVGLADGSGDPQQTVWFLSWVPWAIGHGHNPFLTDHINTPDGVNLMWNSLAPLLGVVLWPITATAGAVVSYDLLVTADLALSAWCAYLLIRRYVPHPLAAFAGGLLYGFSPYLLTQAPSHSKVGFALLPPLLLLIIDDVVVRGRSARRGGLLLGVLLAAQLLVYEEGFVLALVAGFVVLCVLAVRAGRAAIRARAPHVLRALAWALPPLLLLTAVPVGFQVFGPSRLPSVVPGGAVYVTDVANLVVPTATQWISPSWTEQFSAGYSGNTVENASYLGIPLLAMLLLVAGRRWRRPVVAVAVAAGVVLAILSLGPQLHVGGHTSRLPLPWKVISVLPLLGSALPNRLFVYVDLAAAVLLAVFVEDLLLAVPRRAMSLRLAGVGGLAMVVLTLLPNPAGFAQVEVPPFFTRALGEVVPAGATVLVAPFSHDGATATPMLWQAAADMGFRMPEGYFVNVDAAGRRRDGPRPSATEAAMLRIQAGEDVDPRSVAAAVRRELDRWKVRVVVVGPMPHRERMVALLAGILQRQPERHGEVLVWR